MKVVFLSLMALFAIQSLAAESGWYCEGICNFREASSGHCALTTKIMDYSGRTPVEAMDSLRYACSLQNDPKACGQEQSKVTAVTSEGVDSKNLATISNSCKAY